MRGLVDLVDITLVEATPALGENHRSKHWDACDGNSYGHLSHCQNCSIRSAVRKVEQAAAQDLDDASQVYRGDSVSSQRIKA
jgi:hypothetical protein